ncbi:MAG: STAS domain-containing protein [Planctomycetota bacterium]|jgi:anti-sigma B factor antagonist
MSKEPRLLIHPIRDVVIVNFTESSILDTLQVEAIGKELYHLVDERNQKKIILDFSNVQFLSSSALGVLITLKHKCEAIKGKVLICSMRKDLMKVFKITKLNRIFDFYEDEEQALASLGLSAVG